MPGRPSDLRSHCTICRSAGNTYNLHEYLSDKDEFPGTSYCEHTKNHNIPYIDDSSFAEIVLKIRELAGVWGWTVQEQEQ